MGQEIVKCFKELVDRLKEANQQGKLLEHVKLVEGPTEMTIAERDLPFIMYEILDGGATTTRCFPRGAEHQMVVSLTMKTSQSKGYYSDDRVGILDLYEKVEDVIFGDTAIALKGNNNWGTPEPQLRIGNISVDNTAYNYYIEVTLTTPKYTKGTLQD